MERTPLRSSFSSTVLQYHEGVILRRNIVNELSSHKLQHTVLQPMLKYYFACIISSLALFRILKKESLSVKFVGTAGFFSLSFLYLQIYYEEKVFLFKGLEDSETGNIIRKAYMQHLPNCWVSQKFSKRQEEIQKFQKKYKARADPLEKFEQYAALHNFSLEKLKKNNPTPV